MTSAHSEAIGLAPARRPWAALFASGALLLLLGTLAGAIVLSQSSARSQVRASLGLRGKASAGFVASSLSEQAVREQRAAERFLSSPHVDPHHLEIVTTTLGSDASVLLDGAGRELATFPRTDRCAARCSSPRTPTSRAPSADGSRRRGRSTPPSTVSRRRPSPCRTRRATGAAC